MYRKFDLMTNTDRTLRALFSMPYIATTVTEIPTTDLFAQTLNLAQLNHCYITIPRAPLIYHELGQTALFDIYRKTRLNIYGENVSTLEIEASKIMHIQTILNGNVNPIAATFVNFVKLGLFSQAIWLYAAKMTLDKCLNDFNADYFTAQDSSYPNFLSIIIRDPTCIEITYIEKLHCSQPLSMKRAAATGLSSKMIFSGVFLQKVQFRIYPSITERTATLFSRPLPDHITLQANVAEASYYLEKAEADFTPADLGFKESIINVPHSDLDLMFSQPPTPMATPFGSPRTPRRTPTPYGTPINTPARPAPGNPFLQPPFSKR